MRPSGIPRSSGKGEQWQGREKERQKNGTGVVARESSGKGIPRSSGKGEQWQGGVVARESSGKVEQWQVKNGTGVVARESSGKGEQWQGNTQE